MSALNCVRGVLKGSTALSDRELETIIKDVRAKKREAAKQSNGTQTQQLAMTIAAKEAERRRIEAAIQRRNSANNMIKQRAMLDQRANYRSISEFVEAMAEPSNRNVKGARDSATAKQNGYMAKYTSGLAYDLEKEGVMSYVSTRLRDLVDPSRWGKGPLDDKIAIELWEHSREGGLPGSTKSKEAQKIAEIIYKWQETARADLNRLGAFIGKIPGYIVSQSHDMVKVHNAGFDKWYNTILPRLDQDRTFEKLILSGDPVKDAAAKKEFLRMAWNQLSQGEFLRATDGSGFKGPGNMAKRVSQSRSLHFKDAKSWIEYNDEFGTSSLMEAVLGGLMRSGKAAGLMEKFGTNPKAMFDSLIEISRDHDLRKGLPVDKRVAQGGFTSRLWNVIDGTADIPARVSVAQVAAAMRAHQSLTKLGAAVLSSLPDVALSADLIRNDFGENLFSAVLKQIKGMVDQFGDDGLSREYAMLMGTGIDSIIGDMSRMTTQDAVSPKVLHKMTNVMFKLNVLSPWTDAGERSLSMQMGARIASYRAKPFTDLPEDLKNTFERYSIGPTEWDILREYAHVKVRGQNDLLAGDQLRQMPLKAIDPLIEWPLEAMRIKAAEDYDRIAKRAGQVMTKIERLHETLSQQGEIGQQIDDLKAFSDYLRGLQSADFKQIQAGFDKPIEKFATAVVRFAKKDLAIMDQHAKKIANLQKKMEAMEGAKPEIMLDIVKASNDLKQVQIAFAESANDLIAGKAEDITKAARLRERARRLKERIDRLSRQVDASNSPPQTVEDLKGLSDYVKTLQDNDFRHLVEKHRGDIVGSISRSVARFAKNDERITAQHKQKIKELKDRLTLAKRAEPAVLEKLNEAIAMAGDLAKTLQQCPQTMERALDRRRELGVQELESKLNSFYVDRTHMGVIKAGAREKTYTTQGAQAGTPLGEAARFVGQFKQYPLAFVQKVLGRYAEEDKFWSIPGALAKRIVANPTGTGKRVASLVLTLMVMGYLSMVFKDLAKGRTPRDPRDPRTWGAAFVQGGGAGLYGDYLFSRVNRFGSTLGEAAVGPTLGTLFEGGDLALQSRDAAMAAVFGGDDEFPDVKAFQFFKNNTPFISLFYTRAALDYLILYDAQEALSPGSLRRTERRLQTENKQNFILPPSQNRMTPFTGH